jgi:hypothetical protein
MKKYIINGKEIDLIPYDRDTTLDQASHLCSSKLNQIIQALGTPVPEPKKEYKRWRAEKNEKYYVALPSYGGKTIGYTDINDSVDNLIYNSGNYHQTPELAEKALDKQIALTKLNDIIMEKNEGWVADWSDESEIKFNIFYINNESRYSYDYDHTCSANPFILPTRSKEIAEEIIKNHKDLLDTIWGVESN